MASTVLVSTRSDLDGAIAASSRQPVYFFKHSLICAASTMAKRAWDEWVAGRSDDALYALIEIQRARDVSNELARRTGVRHESPQVLLLRDGQAVWNASHWEISRESLEAAASPDGG